MYAIQCIYSIDICSFIIKSPLVELARTRVIMPLLIDEAMDPFSCIYNVDIPLKLITLLLFSPTYEQF